MKQVRLFTSSIIGNLQKEVNDFIKDCETNCDIIDIKICSDTDNFYTIMVIYNISK